MNWNKRYAGSRDKFLPPEMINEHLRNLRYYRDKGEGNGLLEAAYNGYVQNLEKGKSHEYLNGQLGSTNYHLAEMARLNGPDAGDIWQSIANYKALRDHHAQTLGNFDPSILESHND
jgi:hypothetical protein